MDECTFVKQLVFGSLQSEVYRVSPQGGEIVVFLHRCKSDKLYMFDEPQHGGRFLDDALQKFNKNQF